MRKVDMKHFDDLPKRDRNSAIEEKALAAFWGTRKRSLAKPRISHSDTHCSLVTCT